MRRIFSSRNRGIILLATISVVSIIIGAAGRNPDKFSVFMIIIGAVGGVPALFEIGGRVSETLENLEKQLAEVDEAQLLRRRVGEAIAHLDVKAEEIERMREAIALELETLRGIAHNATSDAQSAKNEAHAAREMAMRAESKLILELVERIVRLEK